VNSNLIANKRQHLKKQFEERLRRYHLVPSKDETQQMENENESESSSEISNALICQNEKNETQASNVSQKAILNGYSLVL
jgi:hypothetical protein